MLLVTTWHMQDYTRHELEYCYYLRQSNILQNSKILIQSQSLSPLPAGHDKISLNLGIRSRI
jgi:hypothetical protein